MKHMANRRQLAVVFRSIASLVEAGVPLERTVGASADLVAGRLHATLATARDELRRGHTFADALGGVSSCVPPVVIGIIRAGERGSKLEQALVQVADQLEREADLAGAVRQALAYPLLLLTAGGASVIVIGTVVVPKFATLLADLGQELPPSTRLLLATSEFMSHWGLLVMLGLGLALAGMVRWSHAGSGRLAIDRLLLRMPLVGRVRMGLATSRACRTLGSMLASGMSLLPALEGAGEAAGDRSVEGRLGRSCERVALGESLTTALTRERVFSPSAMQLIAVGEASGRLALMSRQAGDLAALESERSLGALVNLLEPALVVLFGALVAWVALALLQAVYAVRPA